MEIVIITDLNSCNKQELDACKDECGRLNVDLVTIDRTSDRGKAIMKSMNLNIFPAIIADNKIVAVGCPDSNIIKKIINEYKT